MFRRTALYWLLSMVFLTILSARLSAGNEPNKVDSTTVNEHSAVAEEPNGEGFKAGEMILEHISDSHEWHFFSVKREDGSEWHASICLPVILYTPGIGFDVFNFHKLHHPSVYKGFALDHDNHIVRPDEKKFYDFSPTKNVFQMLIAVAIMLLLFISVARNYKKYGSGRAPKGLTSVVEVIVIFIRDGVAKPMLGHRANKFLPYLLTVFFFIWINNLLGLIPGSANVTGNIAVTATLACLTFILMMAGSRKHFWSHMVAPPGVPWGVLPILIPIEFISNIIVKPVALMIRLFANMLAGHLIVLSFMAIIFIFAAKGLGAGIGASVFSVAFSIFIYLLELLVAALQAYIFTILSALFIGETGHSEHHENDLM
jgi:F-type H+-transporting ATPase subunit a